MKIVAKVLFYMSLTLAICFATFCQEITKLNQSQLCSEGDLACRKNEIIRCNSLGEWILHEDCGELICKELRCVSQQDGDSDEGYIDGDVSDIDSSDYLEFDKDFMDDGEANLDFEIEDIDKEYNDQDKIASCEDDPFMGTNSTWEESHAVNIPNNLEGLWLCPWEEQWFSFDVLQGWSIRSRLYYNPNIGSIDLKLYEDNFNGLTHFIASTRVHENGAELVYNNALEGMYYLRVHGRGDEVSFDLTLESSEIGYGDENELCEGAITLDYNETAYGNTSGFHDDYHASCSESFGPEVVFRFIQPVFRNLTLSLTSNYDSVLYIRDICIDQSKEVRCMDMVGSSGEERIILEDLEIGTYYIFVDGRHWNDQGAFTLKLY